MEKTIVMSLGGSVIVPDKIDISFLKDFKKTIETYVGKGYKFAIYCGGGKIARDYQKAASGILKLDNQVLDWIGINATIMNAEFVKALFGDYADNEVVRDPTKKIAFNKKIIIAAGWKPGWSTDYDAVLLAKNLGADIVVNMSNVDYIYDKDPKKHKDAKKIKRISWKDYRKISGDKWEAGLSLPFDPVAAKEAEKSKLKAAIIGKDLENFEKVLDGKEYRGTLIVGNSPLLAANGFIKPIKPNTKGNLQH